MGACFSVRDRRPDIVLNAYVNQQLSSDKQHLSCTKKILLMGSKGSGKNTLLKQLRQIYGEPYHQSELMEYKICVQQYIINLTKTIYITHNFNSNKKLSFSSDDNIHEILNGDQIAAIKTFFKNQWQHSSNERIGYYLDNIDRIMSPHYLPNNKDILLLPNKSTETMEFEFETHGDRFHIINPTAKQPSNWRQYIHCFEYVLAIIFMVDLSCYCVSINDCIDLDVLIVAYIGLVYNVDGIPRDVMELIKTFCSVDERNTMSEQLTMFDMVNDPILDDTGVILLLNKKDLFIRKIKEIPLNECAEWSDFKDDNDSVEGASLEYFVTLFEGRVKENRAIFTHSIELPNTNVGAKIIGDCQELVIANALRDAGIRDDSDDL